MKEYLSDQVATNTVNQIITPSLEKRRDAWIESIASKLIELDRTLQSLHDNDSFITAIMYASQIAIRTHQEEKLEALRNSVLNSALPTSPEDDSIHIFLNIVDILTPTHLRILKFLDSPVYGQNSSGQKNTDFLTLWFQISAF